MNSKCLLLFYLPLFTFFISCHEDYKPQEGEVRMQIEKSIGSNFEYSSNDEKRFFLPYPVNEGTIRIDGSEKKTALIGKQVSPGKNLYVIPIGRLKYTYGDREEKLVIAIPAEKKYRTMEITGYDELITEYYTAKKTLEYWYANRYGLGSVTDMHWSAF